MAKAIYTHSNKKAIRGSDGQIVFRPLPLFNEMVSFYLDAKGKKHPETGNEVIPKIYNNGSSRSGKTYSAAQLIYTFCDHNPDEGMYIAVLRKTLVDCRKYTFKDFIECYRGMNVLDRCKIVEFPNPKIEIAGNTIEFMGLPDDIRQAPRTDIVFVNEAMENDTKEAINGFLMRCERLAIFDWNPTYAKHWVLDAEREFNVLFTRTTYLDNVELSSKIISNIESLCPWDFRDSHIEMNGAFKVRVWDKPESERAVNKMNHDAGTADRWAWLVYGEGIPAAREGAVFNPDYISAFPDDTDEVNFGLDFGYTSDESVLTRVGKTGNRLFVEYLTYQATKDVDSLFELIKPHLIAEQERRYEEAGWKKGLDGKYTQVRGSLDVAPILVACDSADKYRDIHFVRDLNQLSLDNDLDWQFVKVKKPHIATRIALANRFNLSVVSTPEAESEFRNYIYTSVEGRKTNIPIDKYNHGIDSALYCIWQFYRWSFLNEED